MSNIRETDHHTLRSSCGLIVKFRTDLDVSMFARAVPRERVSPPPPISPMIIHVVFMVKYSDLLYLSHLINAASWAIS